MALNLTTQHSRNSITCAISGISYTCEHMPSTLCLTAKETYHPIFDASYSQIIPLIDEYNASKLTAQQEYLLFLALLKHSSLVEFHTSAQYTPLTSSIIAQCINPLAIIVDRIIYLKNSRKLDSLAIPRIAITSDTANLTNCIHWIEVWNNAYAEYQDSYKASNVINDLLEKESTLERFINCTGNERRLEMQLAKLSKYSTLLTEWTCKASGIDNMLNDKGEPYITYDKSNNNKPIHLSLYYRKMIHKCITRTNIYDIDDEDLEYLVELITDAIGGNGTVVSHTVLNILYAVQKDKQQFYTLGDIDIGAKGTIYRILDASTSVEDANKLVLIDSAPAQEPIESQYPNKLAFIKAKMKWKMAQDYKKSDTLRNSLTAPLIAKL